MTLLRRIACEIKCPQLQGLEKVTGREIWATQGLSIWAQPKSLARTSREGGSPGKWGGKTSFRKSRQRFNENGFPSTENFE